MLVAGDFEFEFQLVDGDLVFSRVDLKNASEEGLRREEGRNPDGRRVGLGFYPQVKKTYSSVKILDPRTEWFEGGIG